MPEPVIHIDYLSRSFGPVIALDDLSLEVPVGIVFGFLGPNGAGKTTTIHLLYHRTRHPAPRAAWAKLARPLSRRHAAGAVGSPAAGIQSCTRAASGKLLVKCPTVLAYSPDSVRCPGYDRAGRSICPFPTRAPDLI